MRVTAVEAQARLEHYCELAKAEPVEVLGPDGRPEIVLVDFDEFVALQRAAREGTDSSC